MTTLDPLIPGGRSLFTTIETEIELTIFPPKNRSKSIVY